MAEITKYGDIRATSATLSTNNDVFEIGQVIVESDTGLQKIGNGITNYNTLKYLPSFDLNNVRKSIIDNPLVHILKKNKLVDTLAPNNQDSDLTWTRASTATYVDIYGVVRTAAVNEPRQEKDGWLIEGESTNIELYSEQLDNAAWFKTDTAIIPNSINAPDGNLTADKVYPTVLSTGSFVRQDISFTAGQQYTASFYAKAGEFDIAYIDGTSAVWGVSIRTYFDLTNGVVINSDPVDDSGIEELTDGWFRCYIVATASTTGVNAFGVVHGLCDNTGSTTATPNGTDGLYIWGAQLEELSFPTSYIPTTTTAVSRSADQVAIPYVNNLNFDSNYTYYYQINALGAFSLGGRIFERSGGSPSFSVTTDSDGIISNFNGLSGTINSGTFTLVDDSVNSILYENGNQVAIGASDFPNFTTRPSSLILFNNTGYVRAVYGYVVDIKVYNQALNSDEIQFLGQQ